MTPSNVDDHISRDEFREFAQEMREGMHDLSGKLERMITKVAVSDTTQAGIRKDLDDHKAEHSENRKWAWGIGGAGLLAFVKAAFDWMNGGRPPGH